MDRCNYYKKLKIPPEFGSTTEMNKKIENKIQECCSIYRYSYNIYYNFAFVTSRYDHWTLVQSDNEVHLYHKNSKYSLKTTEQNINEYHLQQSYQRTLTSIYRIFNYIDEHDKYVLSNRILRRVSDEQNIDFDILNSIF